MNVLIVDNQKLWGSSIMLYLRDQSFVSRADYINDISVLQSHLDSNLYQIVLISQELFLSLKVSLDELSRKQIAFVAIAKTISIPRMRRLFRAGARGYVTKNALPEDLIKSLHETHQGNFYCSPDICHILIKESFGDRSAGKTLSRESISDRENEVFTLYAKGLDLKEISHALGISTSTVAVHKHNIFRKLGIRTPADALALCYEHDAL